MRFTVFWKRKTILLLAAVCGLSCPSFAQKRADRGLMHVPLDEPRLQINVGGHTGALHALAFTPDSKRLCSAGLDKMVQVWNLDVVTRDLEGLFLRERTIRWQVARGLRGSIFALASAPSDGLLAIGGHGMMGSLGEILLVDPVDGSLERALEGHRQVVCSLAFSADGNWLASMDLSGRAMLWKRGQWQPATLSEADQKTYGPNNASLIEGTPQRPIVILGSSHALLPVFTGQDSDGRLRWQLRQVNLTDFKDVRTYDTVHHGFVTALAASRDGSRLASADAHGNLYLWDLTQRVRTRRYTVESVVASLCYSPDGRTLAVGTKVPSGQNTSQLQIWDVLAGKFTIRHQLPDHVQACAISPDGKRLAYTGGLGRQVFVEPLDAPGEVMELRGKGRPIWKVAFAKQKPFYRVAFGNQPRLRPSFNDYGELEDTFDPEGLQLGDESRLNQSDWLAADWLHGGWTAKRDGDGLQLYQNQVPKGRMVLDLKLVNLEEGRPRSYCWIPDRAGKPFAIAVGTDRQNSIYVCRLVEQGPCPILRHFRGHHDWVTSLGVSRDLRYLVSGSADGTAKFWSLSAYEQGAATYGRWGAEFATQGDQLVVTKIHPAGPLFRKGMRQGDVLREIRWYEDPTGQVLREEKRPAAIVENLQKMAWGTQVQFEYSRNGVSRPGFLLLPAWQPLATLFVSTDREWAFWTPEGYYDASVNGYTLFGWQVNRGLHLLPEFYRADQFRKKLERPDAMQRLLPAGSLQEALQQAKLEPEGELQDAVPDQIALAPQVEILSPRPGTQVPGDSTEVTARISLPTESKLVRAKVFANGVVATRQKLIDQRDTEQGKDLTYVWDVPLPTDKRNLIQAVVGTDAEIEDFSQVIVDRAALAPRPRKLYVLAVGIDQYGANTNIPSLECSVSDATAVAGRLQAQSRGVYAANEVELLIGKDVTPGKWKEALQELKKKLEVLVTPDDVLIIFLAGHGVADPDTQEYYYLGHDAKFEDVMHNKLYSDCISWNDFQILADIPCRKLAILDTCHSGAIQRPGEAREVPGTTKLRLRDLKPAIRALQEDVIITLTATDVHELAAEVADSKHGVFTKCLLEGLEGRADSSGDGQVALDEIVTHVKQTVPKLAEQAGGRQHPTAAPAELLPYVSLPLTRVEEGSVKRE